jgi:serine/threonine-protein kinase
MTDQIERLTAALSDRYRIERELGSGGMATVYLAQDIKHDRRVAVKVLRPELAAVIGAERFLAEIKTTANLQHSHILPLHDSGSVDGILFYVMPYIDGESLRDRLNREHQLPVNDSVHLATEVASALDYAHRHGVVHRDIKPENILLHDGSALVADFGIALAVSTAGGRMTESGMSLGTPNYMSPEQAMGEREITPRSDVYALGCVTYEMLIGEPPFTGPTAQAIVARVMTEEPRGLTIQRKSIPPHVEAAIRIALSKLPADRFGSAAEYSAALTDPSRTTTMPSYAAPLQRRSWRPVAMIGAVALAIGALLGWMARRPPVLDGDSTVRVLMSLPDSGGVLPVENIEIAISPDGKRIAYIGPSKSGRMLWVRDMKEFTGRPLAGTEDAQSPFFSADGSEIGFFGKGTGEAIIYAVPVAGGMVRTIAAQGGAPYGGDWTRDGTIYFSMKDGPLGKVPSAGGAVTTVATVDSAKGYQSFDYPQLLPGGKGIIIQIWKGSSAENEIGVVSVKTGKVTSLVKGTYARFLSPHNLIFGTSDGRIFSVGFDPAKLAMTGQPVQVLERVSSETRNGTLQFAISENGNLIYIPSSVASRQVVWVGRDGSETQIDSTWTGAFSDVSLSPDGSRIAMSISGDVAPAIWVKRLPGGSLTRLSFVGAADRPVWTPDGATVAYMAMRNGKRTAWMRRADGSNDEQPVNRKSPQLDEIAYTPDGRFTILRSLGTSANTRKILVAPAGSDSVPRPLLKTEYDNFAAAISPNGKWIAYTSNESKDNEVYVRPFPSVDSARWTVSVNGGSEARWSHSGREIFYRTASGDMMGVPIAAGAAFQAGTPVRLFSGAQLLSDTYHPTWDVSPDDKRFIMVRSAQKNTQLIGVVINWRSEIEKLAASR